MRAVLYALLVSAFACAGGGSGGGPPGGDDEPPPSDGPDNPVEDAPPTPVSGLGSTCTPDQANPQGTCPTGFTCLNLMDGTNPWCSKTCQTGANDTCAADYTGPGKAQCVFQITPAGGGAAENFCAVICMDNTGNNQICPAGTCNGTCPGTLACTAPLTDQNNNTVANACE
jgi:hypothetical protein